MCCMYQAAPASTSLVPGVYVRTSRTSRRFDEVSISCWRTAPLSMCLIPGFWQDPRPPTRFDLPPLCHRCSLQRDTSTGHMSELGREGGRVSVEQLVVAFLTVSLGLRTTHVE